MFAISVSQKGKVTQALVKISQLENFHLTRDHHGYDARSDIHGTAATNWQICSFEATKRNISSSRVDVSPIGARGCTRAYRARVPVSARFFCFATGLSGGQRNEVAGRIHRGERTKYRGGNEVAIIQWRLLRASSLEPRGIVPRYDDCRYDAKLDLSVINLNLFYSFFNIFFYWAAN